MDIDLGLISKILHLSHVGMVAAIAAAGVLFWLMFRDREDFIDCIKCWFRWDYRNNDGIFSEEWYAKLKIFVWLACAYAAGIFVEQLIN